MEISVQWGTMNYCLRKGDGNWDDSFRVTRWNSSSAEIAIFENNEMIVFKDDTVKGWCSADLVAKVIFKVSTAANFTELQQQVTNEKW